MSLSFKDNSKISVAIEGNLHGKRRNVVCITIIARAYPGVRDAQNNPLSKTVITLRFVINKESTMFGFFKKKKPDAEPGQGPRLTANQFIALTLSDEKLSMPVYLPGIRSEAECDELGLWPLIYIWNVDRSAGTFSLSVNGKAIAHLLEPFVPREDLAYVEIRDEAMKIISEASTRSVLAMVEKTGLMPDVLFAYDAENE